MTAAGKRLLDAANEALAIAKGEADLSTYVAHAPPDTVDVKAIRRRMNMTQVAFGQRFGFGPARVRDWEQGRTRPAASDRVLLVTIATEPDAVLRALRQERLATRDDGTGIEAVAAGNLPVRKKEKHVVDKKEVRDKRRETPRQRA